MGNTYNKLINADEAFRVLSVYYHHRTEGQADALCDALDRVPEAVVRCENCVFFESGIRCGLRNEQTDYNDFCSKGREKLMNEEEKEPIYCRECKHALLAEYNEGIDVCCLKGGKRKTVSMLDTCEEGEANERNDV